MIAEAINRSVPVPYYYQLQCYLRQQIADGHWLNGDQIPSESELCELFDVSRTTVRQAIAQLVYEGLIYHRKGKGTFVKATEAPR